MIEATSLTKISSVGHDRWTQLLTRGVLCSHLVLVVIKFPHSNLYGAMCWIRAEKNVDNTLIF